MGRVLYHLMVCTNFTFNYMKWRKKIYLDWVSHKFKAEVAKRSQKFVEFSSFCEQYLRNIVRCKEIAVIKICKIAEQGGVPGIHFL